MNFKILPVIALAAIAHAAHAGTLLSADFESPAYSVGTINGQQGWLNDTLDDNYTVVTNNRSFAGSNSLLVTSDDADYSYAWKTFNYKASSAAANAKVLVMDTEIWVDSVGGADDTFAGLEVYGSTGVGAGAYITADTGTLLVLGIDAGDTSYNFFSLTGGPTANVNAWNHLSIALDFSGAAPAYSVALNGTSVNLGDYGLSTDFTSSTTITDADAFVENDGTASAAYFDNMHVQSVPEPATMAALGLGTAAMLRRRKR